MNFRQHSSIFPPRKALWGTAGACQHEISTWRHPPISSHRCSSPSHPKGSWWSQGKIWFCFQYLPVTRGFSQGPPLHRKTNLYLECSSVKSLWFSLVKPRLLDETWLKNKSLSASSSRKACLKRFCRNCLLALARTWRVNYHRFIHPGVSDVPGRCFHFCTRRSNVPEPNIVDLGSNVKPPACRTRKITENQGWHGCCLPSKIQAVPFSEAWNCFQLHSRVLPTFCCLTSYMLS